MKQFTQKYRTDTTLLNNNLTKNTPSKNYTHHFLIASPRIYEGIFHQSLVYICHQDSHGTLGLIINKPNLQNNVGKLFEELDIQISNNDLFGVSPLEGGPVHPEVGFLLHTGQPVYASSFAITENVCLTTSKDILQTIGIGDGVEHFLLCLGHASWAKNQLAQEIANGDWFVMPATMPLLFTVPFEQRWQQAGELQGINFDFLSTEIGHA